ncbi:helix-turn-helix protein [Saccharopolyspora erythraea NRRL 2338]|uniref:Transcriptional regulator, XRE family n=2 Tax=Saccharopolyspora erythraea TaxID=1836 RepID=A4F655_SACEN|nr:helix-turn-helix transcriptional regulator [Saccharopolyspora erythraea]EQD88023.1 XRE family transcriptional regulator [Saccharopolyspora erythraea D]PFG93330.1 helix-turn-helix protein [Saccharopolyspora erythraea NRRL 2338]QRK90171.1 helix-turn-helix domain-containing protein [Saccharopolyspora erythraea]CAL99529.1 transcriptional regulator, XRE family [Saccharopolyspora erythraea NRRL 2338]
MTVANPPVARLQLGQLLRELRESAGKKREDAAEVLECQAPKISKIETGRSTISAGDARLLIDLYGANGNTAQTVLELAREARKRTQVRVPDWARRFVAMESIADEIRGYEPELVPGLLQTAEYTRAHAMATDPGQVDRLMAVREERQTRMSGGNVPLLHVVLNEAVLLRPVGGPEVMGGQLRHLRELVESPEITLQALPFHTGAHAGMGSSFVMLHLRESGSTVVYVEDLYTAGYLDGGSHVERYGAAFDRLRESALDEAETTALLERQIKEYA